MGNELTVFMYKRKESIIMRLNFAITRYSIKDIKITEISKKDRINDLRKKTDILIIDDEEFGPQSFLEKNNYRFTNKKDVDNIRDVSEYPIILCDIRGVGQNLSKKYEGAFLISEIKKNYPDKIVLAYTASQYDASYNNYLLKADDVLTKNMATEDWLETLDKFIYLISDPVYQWKKFRNLLLDNDVQVLEVAKYENVFVKSYMKGDFKDFKELAKDLDGEAEALFAKFTANVLVGLMKAI